MKYIFERTGIVVCMIFLCLNSILLFGQTETVISSPGHPEDSDFGAAVAIADSHFLTLATGEKKVYLHHLQNGSWTLYGELYNYSTDHPSAFSTIALDASPQYAVVGNRWTNYLPARGNLAANAGSVTIYRRISHGDWVEEATLFASDVSSGLHFGTDVSIWEDETLIVGAKNKAYIFEKDKAGNWIEVDQLKDPSTLRVSDYGSAVSVSGRFAVVGDSRYDDYQGRAYIYQRQSDAANWILKQTLEIDPGESSFPTFGKDVANYHSYISVSANNYNFFDVGSIPGAVFTYELVGQQWEEVAILENGQKEELGRSIGHFGLAVAAGQPENGLDDGRVSIFRKRNSTWEETTLLPFAEDLPTLYAQFGHLVDMYDGKVIVGKRAIGDDYVVLYQHLPAANLGKIKALTKKSPVIAQAGGTLQFELDLEVDWSSRSVFSSVMKRWVDLVYPDGSRTQLLGPATIKTSRVEIVNVTLDEKAPAGDYMVELHWTSGGIEDLRIATFKKESKSFPAKKQAGVTGPASTIQEDGALSYRLSANYPNPFNPSTSIQYAVKESGSVKLSVYNIAGQLVATLLNESNHASGEFSATFDASNLPSGIYLYRMEAPGFVKTRKMTLMK